ncbi:hypothetical protein Drorol1_Dr00009687 [Drosera rotundifolia]
MSTVDKMLIKGIRSFDPENRHVITFFRPLTLIVGANGAGKTTIIECLKLSCAGDLPPNTRSGHSFIHDPKVSGETETKAQIKLRFRTPVGKDVVCIRSFQLTQRASKLEFKAIDCTLQTIDPITGEKVSLSYRCADMDREIPALMGVSKAILENVIFVHQDESTWPLQEPATLKKKFDDIFSATRYTKALEVIKKLHKEQALEIKTHKLKLENLQTLKDAAYELRRSIAQDQENAEAMKIQMHGLDKELQEVDAKIHHTETTLKDLRKLQEQIIIKTAERSTLFKEQQKQYEALSEENEDTDEELREWKTKFDQRIARLDIMIEKLKRENVDIETRIAFLKESIESYICDVSKLQVEAESQMSLKNERDSRVQELFAKLNLGQVVAPFSNEASSSLTSRIKRRLMDLEMDLQDKKEAIEVEIQAAWDSFVGAEHRCSNIEAQKRATAQMKGDVVDRIKRLEGERDLYEHQFSNIDLSRMDERERSMEAELERKSNQLSSKQFNSTINQMRTEIYSIGDKIKSLNREKDNLSADSEDRGKLSLKKSEFENLKKRCKKILDDHKDKIRGVLKGRLPSDKDLKKEMIQAFRATTMEFDDINSKSREAEKEVSALQIKIQEVNDNLSKYRKDMDARRQYIESKLQSLDQQSHVIESYQKVLDTAKEKRDVEKSKYNIADGMRQMFDPFERVARAHHICPCCERPFTAEEEDEFVKKQRVKAATTAEHMKVLAVETSTADSLFQQLDKLRMVYEEYVKIGKDTIPAAEKNLAELDEELEKKSQALDDILGVLAQVKGDKDAIESLIQPVETADRLYLETQALQREIDDLAYKLDITGQSIRSMEEIQSELSLLENSRERLQQDLGTLIDEERHMKDDISSIMLRHTVLKEEKVKVAGALDAAKKVEEELQSLLSKKGQFELEEKHLGEALGPASREKERLRRDHNDLKDRLTHEHEKQVKIQRSYQQDIDELDKFNSKIKEYYDLRKDEKLKELQEKRSQSQFELQSCGSRKQELLAELSKNEDLKRNQDQLRRSIDDNLNYRKTKAEVDALTREIESLEEEIMKIGGVSTFQNDMARFSQERERVLSEVNRCRGTLSVYESNISKHKIDLKQTQYKDIDKRYFDQLLQLKTMEMANKDLDRYHNALDKALMRFHTMKMEEINKIIKELWQQTYRGQDIDYIYIHSDAEAIGTTSYSYKVLMQTGFAELEMRGRCSAGQKVLASLIIRLALAETFCLNCGILALDEPTTNLDAPNTESLAAAILRIMEDRKGQENFQLIIITHDERFAQLIGQRQHAEKYYRVYKDELQHSIIEAQEIFD